MGASSSVHHGHLPNANGPFGVGVADVMITDALPLSGIQLDAKDPQQEIKHGLFVRLLYPTEVRLDKWPHHHHHHKHHADEPTPAEPLEWMPSEAYLHGLAHFIRRPAWQLNLLSKALIGTKYIPAVAHAPLASVEAVRRHRQTGGDAEALLPVVVFSHGLGGNRAINTANAVAFATQGFVVAAVEHSDESASYTYRIQKDGTSEPVHYRHKPSDVDEFHMRNPQVHYRAAECVEALRMLKLINEGTFKQSVADGLKLGQDFDFDSFKDRLDISLAAIAGHSFGGATSLIALSRCPSFTCGVVLDGWMHPVERDAYALVNKPVLFLNAWGFQWKENIQKMMQVVNNNVGEKILYTIKGSEHQSFADTTYFLSGYLGRKMKAIGEIDPYLCGEIYAEMSHAFIRKHTDPTYNGELTSIIDKYQEHLHLGTNVIWAVDEEENKSSL